MILVLHGDNVSRSREIMKQFQNRKDVEAKKEILLKDTTPEKLSVVCNSFDFFGNAPFVVLDITSANSDQIKKYLDVFKQVPSETILILYSEDKINKRNVLFKHLDDFDAKEELSENKIPHNIFKYLDYLFSGDRVNAYRELQKLKTGQEDDFKLFSMLLYGFRNVANCVLDSPKFQKLAPFVKNKARQQAALYDTCGVLNILENFYTIDKQVKTGALSSNLMVSLAMEKIFDVQNKSISKR